MEEKAKYTALYASGTMPRYGHTNHGRGAAGLIERWQPASVLDVGCGYNEFVQGLRAKGIAAHGVDFACPGADEIVDLLALPYGAKQYDLLTAFDVLEHLRPDEVSRAIDEMARVSTRFCVSISYVASVNKWQGQTLHPTVRNEDWWINQLVRAGAVKIVKHGHYLTGQWAAPLRLAPEARVVLVGNGPSVLASQMGSVIDAFDVVIRFNNFKLPGFEAHVGSKVTYWSTFFRRIDDPLSHDRVICIHEEDQPPASVVESYHLASVFYARWRRQVQERSYLLSGGRKDVSATLASSGLLVTLYLLDVVGVERVHLCGFDHFAKTRSSLHHYWLDKAFKQPAEHDGAAEAAIFADLAAAGRVAYL